jgi:hypothetical protein
MILGRQVMKPSRPWPCPPNPCCPYIIKSKLKHNYRNLLYKWTLVPLCLGSSEIRPPQPEITHNAPGNASPAPRIRPSLPIDAPLPQNRQVQSVYSLSANPREEKASTTTTSPNHPAETSALTVDALTWPALGKANRAPSTP